MGKTAAHRRVLLAVTLAALVCAAVCLGVLSLYFGSLYPVWVRLRSYFDFPLLVVLNIAPVVVLILALYALTDRAWLSFLLTAALVVALTYINYYKVVIRGDVLVMEDVKYAVDAAGILDQYTINLGKKFVLGIGVCVAGTVFLGLFCRGRVGHGASAARIRFLALAAVIAVGMFGYRAGYESDSLYNSFENYQLFNQWKDSEDYASRGFLYPFLHSATDLRDDPPEGYSPTTAQALLADDDWTIPEGQQVNFLCMMMESFSDFSVYDTVTFTQDPYADFHTLEAESWSGTLVTDTFGGGTVNTERSFTTGFTKLDDFNHAVWSYPRWFAQQGYTVTGSHPGHDWFYNRQNVDRNLGFSDYKFMENYYSQFTDSEYAYDDVFLPQLAQQVIEGVQGDTPYFNFSVNYQGHGPYDSTTLLGEEFVSHDGLSDGAYYTFNNYLRNVADTGSRLLALSEELEALDEPVVLVLFGDHKPTLGASNAYYAELGINIDRDTDDGLVNYYATPYLIWANSAAKEVLGQAFQGDGPTITPAFLMSEVFSQCGWEGPAFLQITEALKELCPVVQKTGKYITPDGTVSTEVPEAAKQALSDYLSCQYYLRKTTAK
jgi:phosphoglycerol transferase MdoB-like AlkP superfamily enzyme